MTTKTKTEEAAAADAPAKPTYVSGIHASRVRAEHHDRRVELLARDDVLANEIEVRATERHDISEALALLSEPASAASNVVSIAAQ